MLEVPETETSGAVEKPPPCFRCLFDKPISDYWCMPETCDMLSAWLTDDNFEWSDYLFGWLVSIDLKNVKRNELPVEF